jgi:hypothetical protein
MQNMAKKDTGKGQHEKPNGAPKENRNAMRHGLRAGQLPKGAKFIEHRMNAMRRQLEDAVIAAKSEISLQDAANIQTCIKWERHGALAQLWLRKKSSELKPNELLNFSREIADASDKRDKAIERLKLDTKSKAFWLPAITNNGSDDEESKS